MKRNPRPPAQAGAAGQPGNPGTPKAGSAPASTRASTATGQHTAAPAGSPPPGGPRHALARLGAWVRANKQKTAILACGVAVVLVAALLLVVLGPGGAAVANSLSASAPGAAASAPSTPQPVEPFNPAQYVGTVLPAGERAGMDYAEETLFLGDSNTVRMMYYADVTGVTVKNGFGLVGMGIQSFTSLPVARFSGIDNPLTMPEIVKLMQPRRVVITFGSNNVGMRIESFIDHYKTALATVKKAYSYADIIIGSIFPVDEYRQNTSITMANIEKMNTALAQLAREENVKFLNWSEAIFDEENGHSLFEATIQDGVHLTRAGMQAIFDYFFTHPYITEDTRPKPLNPIPKRIETQPPLVTKDPHKVPGPIDWSKQASSQAALPVTVVFSAWDESNGAAGGGTVSAASMTTTPGGTTGAVTASAAAGYTFAGWSFSGGASGSGNPVSVYVDPAVAPGSTLTVTAVFRKAAPTTITVPDARSGAADGWTVNTVYEERSDVAEGTFLYQTPAAGATLDASAARTITVVLAKAPVPTTVTVPDASNAPGWTVNTAYEERSDVAEGTVLYQTPAAGTTIDANAAKIITVVLAKAPAPPDPPPTPSESEGGGESGTEGGADGGTEGG